MPSQNCTVSSKWQPSEHKNGKLDPWYEWLIHSRHAGDPAERRLVHRDIERYADKVLPLHNLCLA